MKSIIQKDKDTCYLCGKYISNNREEHHIFNGNPYRNYSEEDGMKVYLHGCCHRWLHSRPISNKAIKARCQRIWQQRYGSEDDFRKKYGKSYL